MNEKQFKEVEPKAMNELTKLENILLKRDDTMKTLTKDVCLFKDGNCHVRLALHTNKNQFDEMDKDVATANMIQSGWFNDIKVEFDHNNTEMTIFAIFGAKEINTERRRPSGGTISTEKVLKDSVWAMKEMYDCLCGMYSEQGEGFASTFVKDENKMMDTAEDMIPYMEALLEQVKSQKNNH